MAGERAYRRVSASRDVMKASSDLKNLSSCSGDPEWHSANGKIILFGEHAVVYGALAIAAAVPNAIAVKATCVHSVSDQYLSIPRWQIRMPVRQNPPSAEEEPSALMTRCIDYIVNALGISKDEHFTLDVDANIPHASGLGASAALSVAITRAVSALYQRPCDEARVNDIAYACEQFAHGSPSGLDNTLATYGGVQWFRRQEGVSAATSRTQFQQIQSPECRLLVVLSGRKGFTSQTVARVRDRREQEPERVGRIFKRIDAISHEARHLLTSKHVARIGALMTENQQYLAELGVSCAEIDDIVSIALDEGALGAKLTGSGDGGAVIVFSDSDYAPLQARLTAAGYTSFITDI